MLAQILWSAVSESSVPAGSNAEDLRGVVWIRRGASTIEEERRTGFLTRTDATRLVLAIERELRLTVPALLTDDFGDTGAGSGAAAFTAIDEDGCTLDGPM